MYRPLIKRGRPPKNRSSEMMQFGFIMADPKMDPTDDILPLAGHPLGGGGFLRRPVGRETPEWRVSPSEKFTCDYCGLMTATKGILARHMREEHSASGDGAVGAKGRRGRPKKVLCCEVCGFRTFYLTNLKRHRVLHTGERPYACHVCAYRAAQASALHQHLFTHSAQKPHECPTCGYRTAIRSNLKRHQLCHSGDRAFPCDVCQYRAAQAHDLAKHKMTHSGVRPFSCGLCAYRAVQRSHLKQHSLKHRAAPR